MHPGPALAAVMTLYGIILYIIRLLQETRTKSGGNDCHCERSEAISHLSAEIAANLSGARNDTFIERLRELSLDLVYIIGYAPGFPELIHLHNFIL